MTMQDLLREAAQLSPKEQLQLATQLLRLVDRQLSNSSALKSSSSTHIDTEENSIGYLLAHPISVRNFKPLSRDEIYERC
ncbi:hypothetical protein IQ254_18775 [Nodosilinea sp. LEGE 07088]|uniref:hypothetical protein n=1 Tax=Nodosilinea sp. LEGE 07088 TaxID=2777968 RepID=UPI001880EB2F|nr:hypothetical protein [Nodosilinea sp. LEGE 07088]MBE9139215.1 hypothetical protein [Nodosilinea sp. LEGE 07088]